jgi:predicted DNA-binding transcriptional regulator YafY
LKRFDRSLAILLLLRSGKTFSASDLAKRMEVSIRTIYRDIETLSEAGVPVYAEIGRDGGYRLAEGYYLPPIAFTTGEATSLLTGLALLDRLRTKPFATELDTAARKILAVVPDSLQNVLAQARRVIGFEAIPEDIFHPERSSIHSGEADKAEAHAITVFLRCILDQKAVELSYRSPYRDKPETQMAVPYGIIWDRDKWYLVGQQTNTDKELHVWRADRVIMIAPYARQVDFPQTFEIERMLGRQWLRGAMAYWVELAPVVIRMSREQAERLKRDWYYAHAHFEELSDDNVLLTFGENNRTFVFELLRWLGPGAELIEPREWRSLFQAELRLLLQTYRD